MGAPNDRKLEALLAEIELPDSAYDKAAQRYEDLGEWLARDGSLVRQYDPHITAQGSFALGTAIHPLNSDEHYDLDLTCKLKRGISRSSHSQFQLKELVKEELEGYRTARRIREGLEEKRRCWRLVYKDSPGFHLDTVPSITADEARRAVLMQELRASDIPERLLTELAGEAIWITDNSSPNYRRIAADWLLSNPAGYVRWFRSRLIAGPALERVAAQVDDIPVYRRKTPLQKIIQLLKRHRDVKFQTLPDSKPVSAIITTVAAQSYRPGEGLSQTLATVLQALDDFRRSGSNIVLNPVNPRENFADKWSMPEYAKHRLKDNFQLWVEEAIRDFARYAQAASAARLVEEAARSLRISLNADRIKGAFGVTAGTTDATSGRSPRIEINAPPRPWSRD